MRANISSCGCVAKYVMYKRSSRSDTSQFGSRAAVGDRWGSGGRTSVRFPWMFGVKKHSSGIRLGKFQRTWYSIRLFYCISKRYAFSLCANQSNYAQKTNLVDCTALPLRSASDFQQSRHFPTGKCGFAIFPNFSSHDYMPLILHNLSIIVSLAWAWYSADNSIDFLHIHIFPPNLFTSLSLVLRYSPFTFLNCKDTGIAMVT